MRISDWSSDVCSSDLGGEAIFQDLDFRRYRENVPSVAITANPVVNFDPPSDQPQQAIIGETQWGAVYLQDQVSMLEGGRLKLLFGGRYDIVHQEQVRSEEHTSELQSLMRISYADFCLKKKTKQIETQLQITQ